MLLHLEVSFLLFQFDCNMDILSAEDTRKLLQGLEEQPSAGRGDRYQRAMFYRETDGDIFQYGPIRRKGSLCLVNYYVTPWQNSIAWKNLISLN